MHHMPLEEESKPLTTFTRPLTRGVTTSNVPPFGHRVVFGRCLKVKEAPFDQWLAKVAQGGRGTARGGGGGFVVVEEST